MLLWFVTLICYFLIPAFLAGAAKGYLLLRESRLAENTPTSKITTGAVGSNVEIKGTVITNENKTLTSPVTKTPCALYCRYNPDPGRKNVWSHPWFFVDDGSGALALIFTTGAKVIEKGNVEFQQNYQEWMIKMGEPVYVLGYAQSALEDNWKSEAMDLDNKKVQMVFRGSFFTPLLMADWEIDATKLSLKSGRYQFFGGLAGFVTLSLGVLLAVQLKEPNIYYFLFILAFAFCFWMGNKIKD